MHSMTLGRAAAAASLVLLLVPGSAAASWWDGDYDGRHDNGYSGRRNSTTTKTERTSASDEGRRDYAAPEGEGAPAPCRQPSPCEAPPPPPCEQAPPCGAPPPPPPPPPPGAFGPIYGCENSDLPDTGLLLHKRTTPPPGTPVRPGNEILVEITWHPFDFAGPELHKVVDCVYINGLLVPGLSGGERLTPNDGHFAWHYFVPLDVPPGSEICDQGFASGSDGWDEYGRRGVSEVVCFPVDLPPPPPPAPACCDAAPRPPCCEAPPPVETTTTTTTTVSEKQPEPYAQSVRSAQGQPPAETLPIVQARDVLPRTGSAPSAARLAAGSLALLALIRRGARRS